MSIITRLSDALVRLAEWLTICSLGAIAIIVPWEVFSRYIFDSMAVWSSEFCQYCLVCASMMGAAAGLRKGYQVGITTVMDKLTDVQAEILQGIVFGIVIVFCAIMTWYSALQMAANWMQTSSTMGISMSIPYASMPLGFAIMTVVTLAQLAELRAGRRQVQAAVGGV